MPSKTEKSESGEGNASRPKSRLKNQQAAESGGSDLTLNDDLIVILIIMDKCGYDRA